MARQKKKPGWQPWRPPKRLQRSKGRGSHGAKAHYKVHAVCKGDCKRHQPIERIGEDGVCFRCQRRWAKARGEGSGA